MNIPFSLSLMLAGFVFFGAFLISSILNYKSRFNLPYSLRNTFPYELNYRGKFKDNISGNVSLIISTLCLATFFAVFMKHYNNGFYIATLISGALISIASLLLVFVPLTLLKFHLALDLIMFVFTMFANGILATGVFFSYYETPNILFLISGIIASIFTVIIFILIMNPKLSRWANLAPEPNKDGSVSYKRPKYFVLAFSEWTLIILTYLTMIPIFILMFTF